MKRRRVTCDLTFQTSRGWCRLRIIDGEGCDLSVQGDAIEGIDQATLSRVLGRGTASVAEFVALIEQRTGHVVDADALLVSKAIAQWKAAES